MKKRNTNKPSRANGSPHPEGEAIEVVFALEQTVADEVYLAGDFNEWSASNLPMIRRESGRWEKRVVLVPGRYEYKFIVDGRWTPDATRSQAVLNAFGSTNSLMEVVSPAQNGKGPA